MIKLLTCHKINFASNYGLLFGLIFQIIDDHIDQVGKHKNIGKTPGKDKKQMKSIILNYHDNKNIKNYCKNTVDEFLKKNIYYFNKWPTLIKLLNNLINQLG